MENQDIEAKPRFQEIDVVSTQASIPAWKVMKAADGDTALALFENEEQLHEAIDPVEERKLIWKIDLVILPCLAVCYAFYYVSRLNTGRSYGYSILISTIDR